VLTISDAAVRRAFRTYQEVYGRQRYWGLTQYAPLWDYGRRAFSSGAEFDAFKELYKVLRFQWLVFRSSRVNYTPPPPEIVFALLSKASHPHPEILTASLSTLRPADGPALRGVLQNAAEIKVNNGGSSLVAASKFLHFWNPKLFVIVDAQVMDGFVFQQDWLYNEIDAVNKKLDQELARTPWRLVGPVTRFRYEAILHWSSSLLHANPNIPALFADFARGEKIPEPLGGFAQFEGAAVEMLLLGLANMPPAGVQGGAEELPGG
jgi:hypothetical protein